MTGGLFARTDRSPLGTWWWTVDRTLLGTLALLAAIGVVLVFAASPPVAIRKFGARLTAYAFLENCDARTAVCEKNPWRTWKSTETFSSRSRAVTVCHARCRRCRGV